MYSILGNFGDSRPLEVISTIVKDILGTSKGELSKRQYVNQLRILANLRNLGSEIEIVMESIVEWFKIEKDPFYQRGQKEGMEKGLEKGIEKGIEKGAAEKTQEFVKALLLNTKHPIREIAGLANVSESFVRKVKKSLQA